MNELFKKWEIVPVFLILIFLGGLMNYLNFNLVWIMGPIILSILILIGLMTTHWFNKHFKKQSVFIYKKMPLMFFLIAFLLGFCFNYNLRFTEFIMGSFISLIFTLNLVFGILGYIKLENNTVQVQNDFNENEMVTRIIMSCFMVFYLSLPKVFGNLTGILAKLSVNISGFLTCALSLVLLSATLSLLAFTYLLVLENNKQKENIMKNGEYFFSATLISIILLFSTLILIAIVQTGNIPTSNQVIMLNQYFISSCFAFFFCIIILTGFYSIIYLLKGFYGCCKSLPIKWNP